MFSISKKNKRKEVDSTLTPSLPRLSSNPNQQGVEKNSLPPTTQWNYASRSSSISTEDRGSSAHGANKCKSPESVFIPWNHHSLLCANTPYAVDARKNSMDYGGFTEADVQDLFEKMLVRIHGV